MIKYNSSVQIAKLQGYCRFKNRHATYKKKKKIGNYDTSNSPLVYVNKILIKQLIYKIAIQYNIFSFYYFSHKCDSIELGGGIIFSSNVCNL